MNDFWSRRSSREKLVFVCCLIVAAALLAVQGVVGPYETLLESRETEIQAKQIRLAKYKRWTSAGGSRSDLADALVRARETDGPEAEMSRFLKLVESMARESSVRVTDLKPLPLEDRKVYREYKVDLQTEASLEALARFLYRMQTSPLLLEVPRFALVTTQDSFGGGKLRMSLTISRRLLPSSRSNPRS